MSSAEPNPANLCGEPVKRLLRDYFLQFTDANIINWCRTNNRKVITIPPLHRTTANLIASLAKMPKSFIKADSVWSIPERTAMLFLESKKKPGEIWGFQLQYVAKPPVWVPEHLSPLGEQVEDAKQRYSALLTSARMYLQVLAGEHPELRTIGLELDKDTVVLKVNDLALGATYTPCIHVKSWVTSPEEYDAAMAL